MREQQVQVFHGDGPDAGTVALQVGDACVWLSSADELRRLLEAPAIA